MPDKTTYVMYLIPGSFMPEEVSRTVDKRDTDSAAKQAPAEAFAFYFYDVIRQTVAVDGQDVTLSSRALNRSPRYYLDAVVLDADAVAALPGDHHILLSNMRANRWPRVVQCRTGNFQPLQDGDVVLQTA
jgi:hypothetical protein